MMDVKPVKSFTDVCKRDALRDFIAERFAAAAREILAAVERTVSGYEEDASGLREEIDRQRRQLEARTPNTGVQDAEGEEEEEEFTDRLEDLNNRSESRSVRVQTMKPDEAPIAEPENCAAFRICILDDSQRAVTSHGEWKEVRCPRGLQEADFLDLLRSSFPQMGGDKLFDVLTAGGNKKLHPLKLKRVTPEEIHSAIRSAGSRKSPLYLKLKVCEEEIQLQKKDDKSEDCLSTLDTSVTDDEPGQQTSPPLPPSEGNRTDVLSNCTQSPEDMEAAESGDAVCDEVSGTAGSWEPDERKDERRPKKQKCKMIRGTSPGPFVSCPHVPACDTAFGSKVCGCPQKSGDARPKRALTHVDDPGRLCGARGERSESAEAFKDRLQSRHVIRASLSLQRLDKQQTVESGGVGHESCTSEPPLEDQRTRHEAGKPHACSACCEGFDVKEQLEDHLRTHSDRKTYRCGLCGKSLSDRKSLSRHKLVHSGERPHSCAACGKRFKLVSTLQEHQKIHTVRERTYLCDVCCKMFLTSSQLDVHMRTHTKEKPYHCGECGKGFTTRGPLTIHMRVHTGETPYRCPECGWSFKRKTHLDNHLRIHSGQKPYVCGVCGKACARKTYLTVHMRTHNGERPYQCPVCDKAFTQSHRLKTHMKSHQGAGETTTPP